MKKWLVPLLLACAAPALAQTFPQRAVHVVVPFPPGGSTDITARLVAPKLQAAWKQPVVVENKPGAGANIGAEYVAKSAPDGHTLLLATTALAASAAIGEKLGYDPRKDLAPVLFVSSIANVLVVPPSLPVSSAREFVALAKAQPGKLNFASPGATTGQRLAFELFKQLAGIDVVHVPYKGGAPAGAALISGEVQSMIMNVVEAMPHLKAGRIKALAATTAKRTPMLPDLPTLSETVAPGLDASVWQGLLAPAGTPKAVIAAINRDFAAALAAPDVRERLAGMGMELSPGSPAEFEAFLRNEIDKWSRVAQAADVKPE